MSTVPIPQGSTIAPAVASAASSVPIPDNSIIEQQPGKGITSNSMSQDYQFKNPALTDDETQQLKAANLSRPLYRKILGLPSDDAAAASLENKDQAHETESAQHSGYVRQQLTDKAVGGAVVAAAPAVMPSSVAAAGPTAAVIRTVGPPLATAAVKAAQLAKSPAGKELLNKAGWGTALVLAKRWGLL